MYDIKLCNVLKILIISLQFTYSENFNKFTELSTENYLSWKTSILHFLDMNNLIDLTEKIVNKVNKIENFECYLIEKKKKHEETIYFANGKHLSSTYIGDIKGFVNNNKITLHNVLLIP